MLDSSSTTKQSGADEGASGGEGTSDTADADFGSGKAAVLAIAITNRRTRMPACGPSYWWAKGVNYEFPDPAGAGRNGSLTVWNVLRFDGRCGSHRRRPGAERRVQRGTRRGRGRQTPAAWRPCVLTPSSPEPAALKG